MVWIELALLLAATALSAVAWQRNLALAGAIATHADRLRRSGVLLIELRRRIEQQQRIAETQQLAETAVEAGTEAVRRIHFGIAAIPFGILGALAVTRDAARVVRQSHDVIADAVYGTIRGINKLTGQAARGALGIHDPDRTPLRAADDE
ncbi:hypothetical protein [Sinimarinibacterium thermocellulolyticum]|uniref:Uncharacterized protein n=1 Tax=Sinimarinibacterium thermocellulolyticum TaxID=3170016 RepID=A0ABV2A5D0_9GAMM